VIPNFSDYESDEDPTYDVDSEVLEEYQAKSVHGKEWMQCLHRDDLMFLALFLYDLLVTRMCIQVTNASTKLIGEMIERSDRTVCEWRAAFCCNNKLTLFKENMKEGVYCGMIINKMSMPGNMFAKIQMSKENQI